MVLGSAHQRATNIINKLINNGIQCQPNKRYRAVIRLILGEANDEPNNPSQKAKTIDNFVHFQCRFFNYYLNNLLYNL